MGKISFDVNNGGKLEVCQTKHDGSISVSTGENKGYNISTADFVMLLNYYCYVKSNDIQNDFINYWGKERNLKRR